MEIAKGVKIDTIEYASQGNAILGIRDSGKSYTATYIGERLMDENVPFIAFDPIGVWRNLKLGKNRPGYPVVVAGDNADLPLTALGAKDIVRAAMKENISLVIDLYSMALSKADWRKIVEECITLLLYENKPYGLRHIFIEEAAEFCPQRVQPQDGRVYAAIEKLARMGGNASLGYTVINQRAEEVNKAILELCDCLFLHRQKGRNSLTALRKWLDIADANNSGLVIDSLPSLRQGECWLWMQGSHSPKKIKVSEKNTIHPDRKNPLITGKWISCDVETFVTNLKQYLIPLTSNDINPKSASKATFVTAEINHGKINQELHSKISELEVKLSQEVSLRQSAEQKLESVKNMLSPQYEQMKKIFAEAGDIMQTENTSGYDIWLSKFGGKKKTMLEVLIKRKRVTRTQLGVLIGMSYSSGGFNNYISELKKVGLIKKEGDEFVLQSV